MMIIKNMKNTNVQEALKIKSEVRDLLQSIIDGKKTRPEIEEICVSLINEQVKDKSTLKGFWTIIYDEHMPSDARVDFIYYPTYYATMIMMLGYLMNIDEKVLGFEETLKLGLDACVKTNLSGHGYESIDVKIEVLNLFIKVGLLEFLSLNYDFCRPFSKMINRIFEYIENAVNNNLTEGQWGKDYRLEFKSLLKQSDNYQLKLFVYGTLMKNESNHYFMENACVVCDAVASGYTLYDTGYGYPAVKHSLEGDVSGELYLISKKDLKYIDQLEDNGDLYTREFTIVTDSNGNKHLALIYVYNYNVDKNKRISKWKANSECSEYIWYASYGSNINYERFMRYINKCTDKTAPVESKPIAINHRMYFAQESSWWDEKGVAFIDAKEDQIEKTLGKMYLITKEQFEEIKEREGGWYQNQLDLGKYDGKDIVTFTDFDIETINEPSERYLDVIKKGVLETYRDMTESEVLLYLKEKIK
ncbi:gamma-glutamylcyclotransferase family protein [Intestinibacter sp.]|uniref:gamma-glutamylcyclotransferase family protein n=1 Tax=Intestinibacter sp. TaxID=1965304 RepID=UPI002A749004|nr:gamma-glutamylcyclotransferase family protein [Intestinibacter sp.]MDY2735636.1 gamma-glutamylcyclotransferase family protein [Intestinibacter sp.]